MAGVLIRRVDRRSPGSRAQNRRRDGRPRGGVGKPRHNKADARARARARNRNRSSFDRDKSSNQPVISKRPARDLTRSDHARCPVRRHPHCGLCPDRATAFVWRRYSYLRGPLLIGARISPGRKGEQLLPLQGASRVKARSGLRRSQMGRNAQRRPTFDPHDVRFCLFPAPEHDARDSAYPPRRNTSRVVPRFPCAGGAKDLSLVVERRPPQADKRGPR